MISQANDLQERDELKEGAIMYNRLQERLNRGRDTLSAVERLKLDWEEKRAAQRARISAEYNVTADEDISRISAALNECAVCNSHDCLKATHRYEWPQISVHAGRASIGYQPCIHAGRYWRREAEASGVPRRYLGKRWEDYEVTGDNKRAVQMARWYAEEYPPVSLYYYGACGTGKTFLASLIVQQLIRAGRNIIYGDVPTLLNKLKATFEQGGTVDILKRYQGCDVLVLDDMGAGKVTEWNVGILYEILNDRYGRGKRTVITSNYDMPGLQERLTIGGDFGGERIVSRLREMCHNGFLGTRDRR